MFIRGVRTTAVKKYNDQQHQCSNCGHFDLVVKIYMDHYHILFIPLAPISEKSTTMKCRNCNTIIRKYNLEKYYESITKTPFYLYTIPIILGIIVMFFIYLKIKLDIKV